jgi:putative phosphoserine phosphatase/1-acylglycerol-3-phosphate O-acyltransferase
MSTATPADLPSTDGRRGHGAAFFDLDRTLVRGASGPAFSQALREVGVIRDTSVPGESLLYRMFDLIGETRPAMLLTRQAARLAKGWPAADVREAGRIAAERLLSVVQPFARPLIEEHRAAGRPVVMATTTPADMVTPLADHLGFDAVIATQYREGPDGRYDGTIDGEFVWGPGKLRAIREWSADHNVDVASSWAYSDSYYDGRLLNAVGHPVAVNPDVRMLALAVLRRWPVVHLDVPAGVAKLPLLGMELARLGQYALRPELLPYVRFEFSGIDNIPDDGPAILCANHRSYFDPVALAFTFARKHRPVRFLGKREVFDAPVVGPFARAMGGIPVDRATGSDEPLHAAAVALGAGELVAILPQGTIPRGEAFFDPELKGRWGAAKLARSTGVPVIPIGVWGTEQVWPRSERIPRLWNLAHPPRVTVTVGEPVELKLASPGADTRRIMRAISDLLPPEARERREPTPEELALTYPAGHGGPGSDERSRRPGED